MLKNCSNLAIGMMKVIDADTNAELYKTLGLVDMYAHICLDIIESDPEYYMISRAFSECMEKLEKYVQDAENINIQ